MLQIISLCVCVIQARIPLVQSHFPNLVTRSDPIIKQLNSNLPVRNRPWPPDHVMDDTGYVRSSENTHILSYIFCSFTLSSLESLFTLSFMPTVTHMHFVPSVHSLIQVYEQTPSNWKFCIDKVPSYGGSLLLEKVHTYTYLENRLSKKKKTHI